MKKLYIAAVLGILSVSGFSQSKTIVGIMPFKSSASGNENSVSDNNSQRITAIQDAVSDAFLSAKRFTLVEREKMGQINTEKKTQQSEDFIDGQVVEQSKSLGASYIVTGNVSEASFEEKQSNFSGIGVGKLALPIANRTAKVSFNLKVIDVSTGEIMASDNFSASAKGKSGFDTALQTIKPGIEKFIKDNFKIIVSVASVEEKGTGGEALKVLISGGSSLGFKSMTTLKVFELSFLMIDGKKIPRKKELGKIQIANVEDENFSLCTVLNGGAEIAKRFAAGASIKCEIISE
jgi:hypothetical protein